MNDDFSSDFVSKQIAEATVVHNLLERLTQDRIESAARYGSDAPSDIEAAERFLEALRSMATPMGAQIFATLAMQLPGAIARMEGGDGR